jgi:integrase
MATRKRKKTRQSKESAQSDEQQRREKTSKSRKSKAVLESQVQKTRALELAKGCIIPWLFHRNGKPITSFRVGWKKACIAAGIPGKIPHDFRRRAVRNLERAVVPRSAAMAMVGHKTRSIYQRYAIADEGMLEEAALKLARQNEKDQAQQKAVEK